MQMNILVSPTNEAKIECYDLISTITPYLMLLCFLIGMYLFSNERKTNTKDNNNNIIKKNIEFTIEEVKYFYNDPFTDVN